ncbi:MAG: nicotinate-nucleotide--dimethylbenzimidazole phosphoribosyltransferase [Aquabacterium sp.]|jgi:nicotinate-nucleotide--dimethylbenzimidazole phosphoribosyltransferase|uniref:nicotinate-nucleotide--dimethylbenzimidazole phosphoribosyltransferase n=1 Tax=Aquabacterium sp. TaxID=1872578 RepID=UPI002A36F966|nr:nicotinate-nucleotide--dimethylbenzimidazole phosphoribosyltransferase [Aquabacterium sp.]MDX9844048.1 nicotinate-nucleotide--dimethylbenzimidazole phosphoribosyltransferase [Aquabacterium sp.]
MTSSSLTFAPITDLNDAVLSDRLHHVIDRKTKPLGALGRLEALAHRIGLVLRSEQPRLVDPQMVVFAGDHGLTARGVSAYPSDVTWQMIENFLAGGAAVSVLCRQHGVAMTVVDCGVAHDFAPRPGLQIRKVAPGTADCSAQAAMTTEQCEAALRHGQELVRGLPGNALLLGEMGIGNTSSASLLMARLTGESLDLCTGRGTGLSDTALTHKRAVLNEVLLRHPDAQTPLEALAAFGGFEIAQMVGAVLQAAAENRVILVDGFITTSAVLVAARLQPLVLQRCVFSHQSDEAGHVILLGHLKAQALLQLGLRLGEGSGAALAWPLLESACAILRDMASFDAAGVSDSDTDAGQSQAQ